MAGVGVIGLVRSSAEARSPTGVASSVPRAGLWAEQAGGRGLAVAGRGRP